MEITQKEFAEWKSYKVTQEFYKALEIMKQDAQEFLGNGGSLVPGATEGATAKVVGFIKAVDDIMAMEPSEAPEEKREQYGH